MNTLKNLYISSLVALGVSGCVEQGTHIKTSTEIFGTVIEAEVAYVLEGDTVKKAYTIYARPMGHQEVSKTGEKFSVGNFYLDTTPIEQDSIPENIKKISLDSVHRTFSQDENLKPRRKKQ